MNINLSTNIFMYILDHDERNDWEKWRRGGILLFLLSQLLTTTPRVKVTCLNPSD